MGSVASIKRDPSPGTSATDGSVIRTDMQNLIADVLEGKKDGEHINLLAPFATKNTTYNIAETDIGILGDTNAGGFTLNLPASATLGIKRKIVIIKKIDAANTLTVDANASETIDGALTIALTKLNETVILVSDGTNWRIVAWYNKTLTADLSVDSNKIINLADPASAQDAATKAYVDNLINGVKWKAPVRVATTAALTLASDFENGDTVDGVVLATGDRILIKNQASGAENGIYTVNASGAPTRATDYDASSEITQSACYVREGTVNADQGFVLTNDGTITLGTTALVFVQFTGLGQIVAGDGIDKTGNTLDVDSTVVRTTGAQDMASKGINISRIHGYTYSNVTLATDVLAGTTTAIAVDAEGAGTTDVLSSITGFADGDKVKLIAQASQVITVIHDIGGANSIHLKHKINIFLSEKVPLILERIGGEWYELSGPEITIVELAISIPGTALATGDNQANFICDKKCRLIKCKAYVDTVSSSGLPTFALRKNATDMLSTNITIDASENSSLTAVTPPVIKSDGSQICSADDTVRLDCDIAGTGTKGSLITLWFENVSDE